MIIRGDGHKVYLQDKIYAYIKKMGSVDREQIAAKFLMTPNAVSNRLQRMKQQGILTNRGTTRKPIWTITGPKPVCMRGCAPASLDNLRPSWGKWNQNLAKANAAQGRPDVLIPISAGQSNKQGVNLRSGERCPQNSPPAIPSLADLLIAR